MRAFGFGLQHQLKLIKANNIDSAKSQWYEWKSTWVEQLQESAESAFAELENVSHPPFSTNDALSDNAVCLGRQSLGRYN